MGVYMINANFTDISSIEKYSFIQLIMIRKQDAGAPLQNISSAQELSEVCTC